MEESPAGRLILVVQDNPDHTRLIEDALNEKQDGTRLWRSGMV
jgi:CheY-like chemotaxis protein